MFTCGFNTTVLHHITAVKYISRRLRIVADVKLQCPGLHAHLTEILISSVEVFESQVCASTVDIQQVAS
jgi:hypothetical protein